MNEARTWTRRAHYVIGVNDRVYTSASPTCTRTTTRQLGPDQAFHSLAISKCNAGRGNTSFLCPFPSYFYIFFGLILTVQVLLQGIFFFNFLFFFPFLWKWRNGNSFWHFNEGLRDRWFEERDIGIVYD